MWFKKLLFCFHPDTTTESEMAYISALKTREANLKKIIIISMENPSLISEQSDSGHLLPQHN